MKLLIFVFFLNATSTLSLSWSYEIRLIGAPFLVLFTNPKNRSTHLFRTTPLNESNNSNNLNQGIKSNFQKERKLSNPNFQRGSNYGETNNSTIPKPTEVAAQLGVKPTKDASAKEWKRAWVFFKRIIPILHVFDRCKPADSSLNIACMWWKALASNDKSSPVYDNGLSYDILPKGFRLFVSSKLCRFYPRLHHANVELRTAFLDSAIKRIVDEKKKQKKIRLIALGAGYDLRSIKLLERGWVDEAYELDLNDVVVAKEKLIGPKRLLKRRPWLKSTVKMPTLIPSNLNDIDNLREQLKEIVQRKNLDGSDDDSYHTIFVFEGVMIYLDEGIPSSLLNVTSSVLKESNADGSLCFADRLENIPGGDYDLGNKELSRNGWSLTQWCPKPGLARHMGAASL